MTMTETPVAPPKKRTRRKRTAKPKPVSAFAGMTVTTCPAGCNVEGCIISGKPYCAHPYKGGLQGRDAQDASAVARLNAAKKMLGKKKIVVDNAQR
jgi:hypothetical protein